MKNGWLETVFRGAMGACLGGLVWFVSQPQAGTRVIVLMLYPFNFVGFPLIFSITAGPLSCASGAAAGGLVWWLHRRAGWDVSRSFCLLVGVAIAAAVGAFFGPLLIPRGDVSPYSERLKDLALFGVLASGAAGLMIGPMAAHTRGAEDAS
jgi:hypothetical protein